MVVAVPDALGGSGADTVAMPWRGGARPRVRVSLGHHAVNNSLYGDPVLAFGTPEQRERFLVPFASGRKDRVLLLDRP